MLELGESRAYAFCMRIQHAIAFLLVLGSNAFIDPIYPPNTVSGGTVVAEFNIASGNVKQIAFYSGEEPFVSATRSALAQWHLASEKDGDFLIIVHFRQPNLYYLNDAAEKIDGTRAKRSLPYPLMIIGPAYPIQSLGQESAILKAEILADGSVGKIAALKPAGSLTDVSIDAVRKWKFLSAEENNGIGKTSYVFAVIVYRLPVSEQKN
jgi:hypothetical protein